MKYTLKSKNKKSEPFYDNKKLLMECVPLLIFLGMIIFAVISYPKIPDVIPTHWNAAGEADAFGPKTNLFIIPGIFFIILILLFVLPFMEVFRENMLSIYNYYYAFKVIFSIFFAGLFVTTLLAPLGYDVNVSYVVIGMIGLLFVSMGFILPKLKRNFMFGIRTGWTLSSDEIWQKTHKLGGYLFGAAGLITLILLFLIKLQTLFFVFVISVVITSMVLVFYSYYLYHNQKK